MAAAFSARIPKEKISEARGRLLHFRASYEKLGSLLYESPLLETLDKVSCAKEELSSKKRKLLRNGNWAEAHGVIARMERMENECESRLQKTDEAIERRLFEVNGALWKLSGMRAFLSGAAASLAAGVACAGVVLAGGLMAGIPALQTWVIGGVALVGGAIAGAAISAKRGFLEDKASACRFAENGQTAIINGILNAFYQEGYALGDAAEDLIKEAKALL